MKKKKNIRPKNMKRHSRSNENALDIIICTIGKKIFMQMSDDIITWQYSNYDGDNKIDVPSPTILLSQSANRM